MRRAAESRNGTRTRRLAATARISIMGGEERKAKNQGREMTAKLNSRQRVGAARTPTRIGRTSAANAAPPRLCLANGRKLLVICRRLTGFWRSGAIWRHPEYVAVFANRTCAPCYFNTGVMVIDLDRWRSGGYTAKLEYWMEVQKQETRIYELGSLPPFLLVFAGEVKVVGHRWNQHGLDGDNVAGQCRELHPGPVSLLHWSGKGKPWL
jgi:hypothetical protein